MSSSDAYNNPPPSSTPIPARQISMRPSPLNRNESVLSWSASPAPSQQQEFARPYSRAPRKARAVWDDERDLVLLEGLIEAQARRWQSQSGFKPEGWRHVTNKLNEEFGGSVDTEQIKSRSSALKSDWAVWTQMFLDRSGWGKTAEGLPDCEPEAAEEYCKAHPAAKKFFKQPLKYEALLTQIWQGASAVGSGCLDARSNGRGTSSSVDPSTSNSDSTDERSTPALIDTQKRARAASKVSQRADKKLRVEAVRSLGSGVGGAVREMEHRRLGPPQAVQLLYTRFPALPQLALVKVINLFQESKVAHIFLALKDMPGLQKAWVKEKLDSMEMPPTADELLTQEEIRDKQRTALKDGGNIVGGGRDREGDGERDSTIVESVESVDT